MNSSFITLINIFRNEDGIKFTYSSFSFLYTVFNFFSQSYIKNVDYFNFTVVFFLDLNYSNFFYITFILFFIFFYLTVCIFHIIYENSDDFFYVFVIVCYILSFSSSNFSFLPFSLTFFIPLNFYFISLFYLRSFL